MASAEGEILVHLLHDVGLPADTVEVLPLSPLEGGERLISVGSYLYDESTCSRSGSLHVLAVSSDLRTV